MTCRKPCACRESKWRSHRVPLLPYIVALATPVAMLTGCRGLYPKPAAATNAPHPPFKKLWASPKHNTNRFAVTSTAIYYLDPRAYGALDLVAGKVLWENRLPQGHTDATLAYDQGKLYLSVSRWKVIACDAGTGKELWRAPRRGVSSPMAVGRGLLFCELRNGVLTALDAKTGKPRWTCDLKCRPGTREYEFGMPVTPLLSGDRLFVGSSGGWIFRLDPATGRLRWRHEMVEVPNDFPVGFAADRQRIYVTTVCSEVMALDAGTGKRLWVIGGDDEAVTPQILPDDLLVYAERYGTIRGVNGSDGAERWSRSMSRGLEPTCSSPVLYAGQVFATAESHLFAFSPAGRKLWDWDTEEDLPGCRVTVLKDGVVLATTERFIRYVMGEPPKPPVIVAERQTLAQKFVTRFDKLNDDQRRMLSKLGDEAFIALLPLVRLRVEAYQVAVARAGVSPRADAKSSHAYDQFDDAMKLLAQVATKQRTPELLALLGEAKRADTSEPILECLASKGDERQTIPVFFEMLKLRPTSWETMDRRADIALDAIGDSRDPRALRFLIASLADPKADPAVRRTAFVNLARTGGETGRQAVWAAKDRGRMIPSLAQFMRLDKLGVKPAAEPSECAYSLLPATRLLATHRDKAGILWGLISSNALGSDRDWWIARREGERWINPLFTGTNVIAFGVVDPRMFAKDSDGDGWTDLVEQRLGTDPHNPDTDGDGLKDSMDKNPLAAPRRISEAEQVLAAAFEARFIFSGARGGPCVVKLPEGIKAFELAGSDWLIMAHQAGEESPLEKVFGQGVGIVRFGLPTYDFTGGAVRGGASDEYILWNKRRDEAKVEVSVTYGSLDATGADFHLKKFGRRWVVIGMRGTWVS